LRHYLRPSQTSPLLRYIFFLQLLLLSLLPSSGVASQLFPHYPTIKNNIIFWEKIYSSYSLSDAVIHDSNDLSRIYEVIHLLDPDLPGAQRINRKIKEATRNKYSKILKKLSQKRKAASANERRIVSLFKGNKRFKEMAKAAENVRSQTGQKERFLTGVVTSRNYIKKMKQIFRSYNMPEDLAYLPHVESSFNVKAYSKFGAAGMWQFTRETGKRYLTINYTLDERLDPISATHAAAQYLRNSYEVLNSWPLALTSYNYGTSGTLRAVKEKGSYEKIIAGYDKGHFKFASRNFYSEFLAARNVAKQLEKSSKTRHYPVPTVRYFKLPGYVHISRIESHFGLTKTEIRDLNPALRPPVFTGEKFIPKGYPLRLPGDRKNYRVNTPVPASFYAKTQKRSTFHRVKNGETIGSIANLHGVSVTSLNKVNNLDKYATIYIRQKLRVPNITVPTSGGSKVLQLKRKNKKYVQKYHQNETVPLLTAQKKNRPSKGYGFFIPRKDPDLYTVFNIFKKERKTYGYITVQPEESAGLYAQWLGSTTGEIRKINRASSFPVIVPGEKLLLTFDKLSTRQFEDKRLDYLREIEDDFFSAYTVVGQKTYRVNNGDTFWDLCYNRFEIPMWLLERYNSSLNLSKLKSPQELMIPILKAI